MLSKQILQAHLIDNLKLYSCRASK